MAGTNTAKPAPRALGEALADLRTTAREQLSAAWQLHVDAVQEQLQLGWTEHIERILNERFSELMERAEAEFQRVVVERTAAEMEDAVVTARNLGRRELSEQLNQAARRLVGSQTGPEWSTVLLDAATGFCEAAAVFFVQNESARCEGARFPEDRPTAAILNREMPLASAPALAAVVDSRDTLVVIRSAGELGEQMATSFGAAGEGKAYLFPISSRQKIVAVLYAEPGEQMVDVNALELLASVASTALHSAVKAKPVPGLVTIAGAQPAAKSSDWDALPREEQDIHVRAQRFARVQVAEMRLYKSGAVKAGRSEGRLYEALREDIDASREEYYRQFAATCPSMVDYLHLELVRTLANEDSSLLGSDYPGPLF